MSFKNKKGINYQSNEFVHIQKKPMVISESNSECC